ncbi:MAG: hypothetical protein AAGF31_02220 [Planctomycetota bacterium]
MKTLTRRMLPLLLLAIVMNYAAPAMAQSEDEDEARANAHAKLVDLLDNTDDLFYKARKDNNGQPFYTLIWEADGETTRMILGLKQLGYYNGKYVYAISAWTYVAQSESRLPPAAIKAVAQANDSLMIGSYSCSSDFSKIYANMTGILDGATPGSVWMYCAYLHSNKMKLREAVQQAMAGSR